MKLDINKIHCMDCVKGLKKLDEKSVDIIVTSPPYNIGKKYNKYNDVRPREEYLNWMEKVAEESKRVLKENGSFFLNVGSKPSDLWIPLDTAFRFRNHYILQNTIHWVKSIAIPKKDVGKYDAIKDDIAVGHYKPINSKRYMTNCHEYIFQFTKKGNVEINKLAIGVKYQDKSNIKRWKSAGKDLRGRGNTWFIPYKTIWNSRPHPTVYPAQLPEMCIKLQGVTNKMLVLDPFMGTGATALASIRVGVNYIGFEIDEKYVEVANEKIVKLKKDKSKKFDKDQLELYQ